MITFVEHQVRAGQAGAPADFEQMLGLLVGVTTGLKSSLVFANPGDWGIDVLVGDLNGRITAWQAKYFVNGVGRSQQQQIRDSFATVIAKAAEHGYTLERWVLCVPASMDTRTTQWWQAWKAEQELATGVIVDLWDETTLRELLLRPEAEGVRRHYYEHVPPPRWLTPRHAVFGVLGIAVLGGLVAGAVWALVPGGSGSGVRTPQEWAAQVNPVCRAMYPTLVADLNRVNSFPQSAYSASVLEPQIPRAYDKFSADYTKIAARLQAIGQPSDSDAAVNQWLTDFANRGTSLYRADGAIDNVNGNMLDRLSYAYYIEKFVVETNDMQSLSTQVGVPACE